MPDVFAENQSFDVGAFGLILSVRGIVRLRNSAEINSHPRRDAGMFNSVLFWVVGFGFHILDFKCCVCVAVYLGYLAKLNLALQPIANHRLAELVIHLLQVRMFEEISRSDYVFLH